MGSTDESIGTMIEPTLLAARRGMSVSDHVFLEEDRTTKSSLLNHLPNKIPPLEVIQEI